MAGGAEGDLLIPGKASRVADPGVGSLAVALLTLNPQNLVTGVAERARVAVQALEKDQTIEVDLAVLEAGAVHPVVRCRKPGDRELVEQAVEPVEIALAAAARPDHQVEALGAGSAVFMTGLVEGVAAALHPEPVSLDAGAEDVAAVGEVSSDGFSARRARGLEMCRVAVALHDVPVTRDARDRSEQS